MNLVHVRLFRMGKEFHRRSGHNLVHTEPHGELTTLPQYVPKEFYTMAALLGFVIEMDDHGFVCVWYKIGDPRLGDMTGLFRIDLGGKSSFFPAYLMKEKELPPYQYYAGRWAGAPEPLPFKPDIMTTLNKFALAVAGEIQGFTSLLVTRMKPPTKMVNRALQAAIAKFKEGK